MKMSNFCHFDFFKLNLFVFSILFVTKIITILKLELLEGLPDLKCYISGLVYVIEVAN
jgi:hypothetical protein